MKLFNDTELFVTDTRGTWQFKHRVKIGYKACVALEEV